MPTFFEEGENLQLGDTRGVLFGGGLAYQRCTVFAGRGDPPRGWYQCVSFAYHVWTSGPSSNTSP